LAIGQRTSTEKKEGTDHKEKATPSKGTPFPGRGGEKRSGVGGGGGGRRGLYRKRKMVSRLSRNRTWEKRRVLGKEREENSSEQESS